MTARGGEPSSHQHDLALGEPLDLVQDVRADDDRATFLAECSEERDEVRALHWVGAVQRLVEHEHLWVRDEGRSDLRALPHALAEPTDPPIRDVGQADGLDGPIDRARRRRSPCRSAT